MDAFFSKVKALSDDARRPSSDALSSLSTSTTPSESSDGSDDHQRFPIVSSVYVASHQGDDDRLSRRSLKRDSKTLRRKTLVDIAEGSNDVHSFDESPEAQKMRRTRPPKTFSFDVSIW
jgi:hypothetical protein